MALEHSRLPSGCMPLTSPAAVCTHSSVGTSNVAASAVPLEITSLDGRVAVVWLMSLAAFGGSIFWLGAIFIAHADDERQQSSLQVSGEHQGLPFGARHRLAPLPPPLHLPTLRCAVLRLTPLRVRSRSQASGMTLEQWRQAVATNVAISMAQSLLLIDGCKCMLLLITSTPLLAAFGHGRPVVRRLLLHPLRRLHHVLDAVL